MNWLSSLSHGGVNLGPFNIFVGRGDTDPENKFCLDVEGGRDTRLVPSPCRVGCTGLEVLKFSMSGLDFDGILMGTRVIEVIIISCW